MRTTHLSGSQAETECLEVPAAVRALGGHRLCAGEGMGGGAQRRGWHWEDGWGFDSGRLCDTDFGSSGGSDKVQICLGLWIWESWVRTVDLPLGLAKKKKKKKKVEFSWSEYRRESLTVFLGPF